MHGSFSHVTTVVRRGRVRALILALAATAAIASPVAAATPPRSDYGNTVECRYKAGGDGPWYYYRLKRLVVTPPVVYAQKSRQRVGWRFVVTRSELLPDWKVTYRSPVQRAAATMTVAAAFTAKSVDVQLPQRSAVYHVTLKLYWFRADGTVKSQTSYLMPWMEHFRNGRYDGYYYDTVCEDRFSEGPDILAR